MAIKGSFKCKISENTPNAPKYLRGEHRKSVLSIVGEMSCTQNPETICTLARQILNTEKRNQKIEKHEELIAWARNYILMNLEVGESFVRGSLATFLEMNSREIPQPDNRGRTLIYPIIVATERLVKEGYLSCKGASSRHLSSTRHDVYSTVMTYTRIK